MYALKTGGLLLELGERAADGGGVLALRLGDERRRRASPCRPRAARPARRPTLLDVRLRALEPRGDRLEHLPRDLGEEAHVADEHVLDLEAPARRSRRRCPSASSSPSSVRSQRICSELAVAEDGRRRVRDEVRERAVPVGDREDRLRRIGDAELEPEVDDDRRAARVVDVDVLEVAEVAAQRHARVLRPRQQLRRVGSAGPGCVNVATSLPKRVTSTASSSSTSTVTRGRRGRASGNERRGRRRGRSTSWMMSRSSSTRLLQEERARLARHLGAAARDVGVEHAAARRARRGSEPSFRISISIALRAGCGDLDAALGGEDALLALALGAEEHAPRPRCAPG